MRNRTLHVHEKTTFSARMSTMAPHEDGKGRVVPSARCRLQPNRKSPALAREGPGPASSSRLGSGWRALSAFIPPGLCSSRAGVEAGSHDRAAAEQIKDPITAAAAALPVGARRREREDMSEFIAKKREIFLVQMSLDTKRAEIRKLDQRALQREEALKKSEQMLEEDSMRFDLFLKENDEKVQEAIKRWAICLLLGFLFSLFLLALGGGQ